MTKKHQDIFTPEWMVQELLDHIPFKDGDTILEPTAGDGNMVEPILKHCKGVSVELTANELQKKHYDILKDRVMIYGEVVENKTGSLFTQLFGGKH